jgi:hypothetical protein
MDKSIQISENIESRIFNIRGVQVMIDEDLAELYQVETKVFNQSVKRNIKRFPEKFRFQLTKEEYENLRSQIVTSSSEESLRFQTGTLKNHGGRRYMPYVFTEQGVSMLSAVLKSDIAIEVSIKIMDSFVNMRKFLSSNGLIFDRFERIEQRLTVHDKNFNQLFEALENTKEEPSQGIFYNGQIFEAYVFIADLIKQAKKSIILIDNYVDESVLTLLSKNQDVNITIYTQTISKQLKLDIEKYNKQFKAIEVKISKDFHDRFLVIDDELYHIGASLKDLGKKVFGFSKMNMGLLKNHGILKGF